MALTYRLLLHFDGLDGSTIFTDELGHVFTAYSTAQLDTSQLVFGTASGLFVLGDYIDTPDSADFTINDEFCMDCRIRVPSLPPALSGYCMASHGSGEPDRWSFHIFEFGGNQYIGFQVLQGGGLKYNPVGMIPIFTDTWHHCAATFKSEFGGHTLRVFFDGVLIASEFHISGISDEAGTFKIGRSSGTILFDFVGWIEEYRFVTGDFVWDSNFTPPVSPYTLGPAEPSISQLMRNGKWFSNGISQGFWLGWRT
jgi:hypothetical protein